MGTKRDNMSGDNWDDRVLCRDESCTGTIGLDGHCRECGQPLGDEPMVSEPVIEDHTPAPSSPVAEAPVSEAEDIDTDVKDDEDIFTDTEEDMESGWEDRILCRDEECIGTIGPDGLCRVCGLAYKSGEQ